MCFFIYVLAQNLCTSRKVFYLDSVLSPQKMGFRLAVVSAASLQKDIPTISDLKPDLHQEIRACTRGRFWLLATPSISDANLGCVITLANLVNLELEVNSSTW